MTEKHAKSFKRSEYQMSTSSPNDSLKQQDDNTNTDNPIYSQSFNSIIQTNSTEY